MINSLFLLIVVTQFSLLSASEISGNNFKVPSSQDIKFIDKLDDSYLLNLLPKVRKVVDLKSIQSSVKSQGKRDACTYFVASSLIESLLKKKYLKEVDLSEEYMAWSGKVLNQLRANEESSSVAVNLATFQKFGFLHEEDLPYQESWFRQGMPCENIKLSSSAPIRCFSHDAPSKNTQKNMESDLVFETIDSKTPNIILHLNTEETPVTFFIIGHPKMWDETYGTGNLYLSEVHKEECKSSKVQCGSHAMLITGYDLGKKVFFIKNSWGTKWGNQGYGTIPFEYMDQFSDRKFFIGKFLNH